MNTVLAAIDFSRVTSKVLATATELARTMGGRVVVLHVVRPPRLVTELAPFAGEIVPLTDERLRASRRHLRRIQKRLAARGISVEVVSSQGVAVPSILGHAKELAARYIVLGSHGHTALYDMVVGSTANGVLKRATCPVAIVPAARARPRRKLAAGNRRSVGNRIRVAAP